MTTLQSRIEVEKLADDLAVAPGDLDFLEVVEVEAIRSLRERITEARYVAHEKRLRRLAALSKMAPGAVSAKIAEHALGAELSARVATQVEPAEAAKLTRHLKPEFLTDIALRLDASRAAPVLAAMPHALVVDVGRRVLQRRKYVVLARFVSSFATEVALEAVEAATPGELLTIGIYTEDDEAISRITAAMDDDLVTAMHDAAVAEDRVDDLVALLAMLTPEVRRRSVDLLGEHREKVAARAGELGYPDLV